MRKRREGCASARVCSALVPKYMYPAALGIWTTCNLDQELCVQKGAVRGAAMPRAANDDASRRFAAPARACGGSGAILAVVDTLSSPSPRRLFHSNAGIK